MVLLFWQKFSGKIRTPTVGQHSQCVAVLQIKQSLLSWVRNTNVEQQMAPFLRNKAAQVVVAMVQVCDHVALHACLQLLYLSKLHFVAVPAITLQQRCICSTECLAKLSIQS